MKRSDFNNLRKREVISTILDTLRNNKPLTVLQIATTTGITQTTIAKYLKEMTQNNIVKKGAKKNYGLYSLIENTPVLLPEHSRKLSSLQIMKYNIASCKADILIVLSKVDFCRYEYLIGVLNDKYSKKTIKVALKEAIESVHVIEEIKHNGSKIYKLFKRKKPDILQA